MKKTLYLDCGMGAAGDMLTAALLDLLPDPETAVSELNALGIPGVQYVLKRVTKCGIMGNYVSVLVDGVEEGDISADHHHSHTDHGHDEHHPTQHHDEHDHLHAHEHDDHDHNHNHDHAHHHSTMQNITSVVSGLNMPDETKSDVLAVYGRIAEAESVAHGMPVPEIHFHEVGTMDAVADITAVCVLMRRLGVEQIVASPVHVGSGHVHCAHGILPVPAPATAYILRGVPIYGGDVEGELCTPTGAALIKHFATRFDALPLMRVEKIGYGMGRRDFIRANCVRAFLGQTWGNTGETETILQLSCNLDDMTAEDIGFAMDQLLEHGAREVYTIPAGMKKNRPGTLLRVLCREEEREKFVRLLFLHTSTLGVRETLMRRYALSRETETLRTPYGPMRRKISHGYGVTRSKYEYDDLARIARERQISMENVRQLLDELDEQSITSDDNHLS